MRLDLDEIFYIEGDGNSYTLHKEEYKGISEKTGNPIYTKDQWHYSNFKMCLQKYLDICIAPVSKIDIQEIIKKYDHVLHKIKELK